jgi:Mce-associated membrane protein
VNGRHRDARRLTATALTVVLVVLCIPVAAAASVLYVRDRDGRAGEHARTAATAAAEQAVRDILSYDYRTLDKDIAQAEADTTGAFAQQYRRTAGELQTQAAQLKAIVQATPSTPGIVSADRHEVVVLLFVDQASVKQVAGKKTPTTRIDQSRVRMTMTNVGGRWLVSQLDAL